MVTYRTVCFRGTELIEKKVIKSNTAAHSTTVTKRAQSPVPESNKHQHQHSSRQLPPRPRSHSALPVTWPAPSPVPMNKRLSKQYYIQLTPRPTCPSKSSADTNFPSKRSHHSALQPPSPSLAAYSQVADTPCSSASNCATLGTVPANVAPLTLSGAILDLEIIQAVNQKMKYQ